MAAHYTFQSAITAAVDLLLLLYAGNYTAEITRKMQAPEKGGDVLARISPSLESSKCPITIH